MELDDELCLCFHVTKRKVINFLRVERPQRASQMSECFGAGTGCGWCRPCLLKLWETAAREGAGRAARGRGLGRPQLVDARAVPGERERGAVGTAS